MRIASLSTEQSPPISVPFSFFAVAPAFLLLAAVILAIGGINLASNPHTPALLAATHCITLGFMACVMFGAMQQILPVLVGSKMPASLPVARVTLFALLCGTLSLCAGFLLGWPSLLLLAWPLLSIAFLTFIVASLISLARAAARNVTRTALILAVIALALAVLLGILLAYGYATGASIAFAELSSAHIRLSLGGWVMLLVVGVSYQVVPMFQLTPNYPKWLTAVLAPAIFIVLLLSIAVLLLAPFLQWLSIALECVFWALAVCFALVTLGLQWQRRRRVPDATLNFFRLGMISLILAALFALFVLFYPATFFPLKMLAAIAFLIGFALSVIFGMMYKILPFLVWFHLFRGGMKTGVPNMKQIIPETWMWWHYRLQLGTLAAAACALFWDLAVWTVILGLLLQGLLLGLSVFTAITVYRKNFKRISG